MTRPGLIIACPQERYFDTIGDQARHLFGVDNVLTYSTYDELRTAVGKALIRTGYEFILIAGHGQMDEGTGAPVMLARLTPVQWGQIVNSMVGRAMTAPVVILDGCKSASFLQTFLPLVQPGGRVVCNVGDSSTTVFGQLEPGRTLADAIDGKRLLELAIRPRPGRPLMAPVPPGASDYSVHQMVMWTGGAWRFVDYPTADIGDVDERLGTWLAVDGNSAALLATAQQLNANLPRLSATLFVPSAIYTAADTSFHIAGPFASYPDDLVIAYEHWQRYGPGGEALMVERREILYLLRALDAANINTYDHDLPATVTAIPGQVNPMAALPIRPRPSRRHPPTRI